MGLERLISERNREIVERTVNLYEMALWGIYACIYGV
jgi:hypothetical protein